MLQHQGLMFNDIIRQWPLWWSQAIILNISCSMITPQSFMISISKCTPWHITSLTWWVLIISDISILRADILNGCFLMITIHSFSILHYSGCAVKWELALWEMTFKSKTRNEICDFVLNFKTVWINMGWYARKRSLMSYPLSYVPLVWWPNGLRCWYQFLGHLWCDWH